jgi:hypothetical protein
VATAREKLVQSILAIIGQPYDMEGHNSLIRLLNSYRVQAKPGAQLGKIETARNDLANQLINSWKQGFLTDKQSLNQIISSFRMQVKQGLTRLRTIETRSRNHDNLNGSPLLRIRKDNKTNHENAYFKDKYQTNQKINHTAIAGGPKQTQNKRSQCPKCRSFGIVLARAYIGDDYHSCIYCGYQAYLKDGDPSLDLPLAAKLLQDIKEPKNGNED